MMDQGYTPNQRDIIDRSERTRNKVMHEARRSDWHQVAISIGVVVVILAVIVMGMIFSVIVK